MTWECHACGCQHDALPERCRECGTEPEIVLNRWRCASCGHEDNLGTQQTCRGCGADRDREAQVAVAPELRLEGEVARRLAEGPWRSCAYCGAQAPPVRPDGTPIERCPACGGPLAEAREQAAVVTVSAAEATALRAQAMVPTEDPGALAAAVPPAAEPAPPVPAAPVKPASPARRAFRWLTFFAVILGLYRCMVPPKESLVVVDRTWERTIALERIERTPKEGWEEDLPAEAKDRRCTERQRGEREVPDGEERYTEEERTGTCAEKGTRTGTTRVEVGEESYTAQEPDGKRCAEFGYKMNGGVSVKTCARWEPKLREVTRTRPRYEERPTTEEVCLRWETRTVEKTRPRTRREPVMARRCSYVRERWVEGRVLRRKGGHGEPRAWPALDGQLGADERPAQRKESLGLLLRRSSGVVLPYELLGSSGALLEWRRYAIGAAVQGRSGSTIIVSVDAPPASAQATPEPADSEAPEAPAAVVRADSAPPSAAAGAPPSAAAGAPPSAAAGAPPSSAAGAPSVSADGPSAAADAPSASADAAPSVSADAPAGERVLRPAAGEGPTRRKVRPPRERRRPRP